MDCCIMNLRVANKASTNDTRHEARGTPIEKNEKIIRKVQRTPTSTLPSSAWFRFAEWLESAHIHRPFDSRRARHGGRREYMLQQTAWTRAELSSSTRFQKRCSDPKRTQTQAMSRAPHLCLSPYAKLGIAFRTIYTTRLTAPFGLVKS